MFSSAFNFVRRHRNKFIVVSAVTGGLVVLGKYAESKVLEWQSQETNVLLSRSRKLHHFESTERTANLTLQSIFPAFCEVIEDQLDWEGLVGRIRACKENGAEKLRLWTELKVLSMSRCISIVYGGVLLTLLLRVQLSILGGYLYQETAKNNGQNAAHGISTSNNNKGISPKVQENYLGLCQRFIKEHLPILCTKIHNSVSNSQHGLSLKSKFSIGQFETVFRHLMSEFECSEMLSKQSLQELTLGDLNSCFAWDLFLASESLALKQILADSMDIIEHDDFSAVLKDSAQSGISIIFDNLAEQFVNSPSKSENGLPPISEVSLPLAKIIPMLNSTFGPNTESQVRWLSSLTNSNLLRKYSANVYEAFC